MGVAALSSLAAPLVTSLVGGIAQNFLSGAGGAGGAGGPFGGLLNAFTSAFSPLLNKAMQNPLATLLAPIPTLFSTAGMSPQSFNDPMSQLRPSMDRFGFFCGDVRDHRCGTSTGGSNSDSALLRQLQSDMERTKQESLQDPENVDKARNAQKAAQKFQNAANLIFTQDSILASLQKASIDRMQVA